MLELESIVTTDDGDKIALKLRGGGAVASYEMSEEKATRLYSDLQRILGARIRSRQKEKPDVDRERHSHQVVP